MEIGEDLQKERGCFSSSGLSLSGDVRAVQCLGQDLRLNRRAILESQVRYAVENVIGKIKVVET
jgi:hypothetical protein